MLTQTALEQALNDLEHSTLPSETRQTAIAALRAQLATATMEQTDNHDNRIEAYPPRQSVASSP